MTHWLSGLQVSSSSCLSFGSCRRQFACKHSGMLLDWRDAVGFTVAPVRSHPSSGFLTRSVCDLTCNSVAFCVRPCVIPGDVKALEEAPTRLPL